MKNLKSNLGLVAFVLLAVAATSLIFISTASSQERRKDDDNVSISWSPKKTSIQSIDSKFALTLPDSVSSQDWVVGVIPTQKNEDETMVVGIVSWKDGKTGQQTVIESATDLSNESATLNSGQANFSNANELDTENGKSFLVLLKLRPETEVSVLQKGERLLSKTFTSESGVVALTEQTGMRNVGIKRVTGVSSLLGELQTRKFFQRFVRKN